VKYGYFCEDCDHIWEEEHGMSETPKFKCPECQSEKTQKYLGDWNGTAYIRGYGWRDKAGARRDMNLYTMKKNDPYANHRQSGEATDLIDRLEKGGRDTSSKSYKSRLMTDKDGNDVWVPFNEMEQFKKDNGIV